jgi:hypothetical protein
MTTVEPLDPSISELPKLQRCRRSAFLEAHHVVVTLEGSSQELFEDALAKRGP